MLQHVWTKEDVLDYQEDPRGYDVEYYSAEDQHWDESTLAELRNNYNIYYDGAGVFAVKIIPREGAEPLFVIGHEDDGTLYFKVDLWGNYLESASICWAKNLVDVLGMAIKGRDLF